MRKGTRWWIEYYFRIPDKIRHLHGGKQWKKFRVFEDINRYKTDEYARTLLDAIETGLKDGFDPFEYKEQAFLKMQQDIDPVKEWTCIEAFNYFKQEWNDRGLEGATLVKLHRAIDVLTEWLTSRNFQHEPVKSITKKYLQLALKDASNLYAWENRTYNNNLTALATLFNFLVKEKIIPESPVTDIDRKKTKSKKHRYYDPPRFEKVRKIMEELDPLVHFATKLIYYLCIRSEKELKHFKVGNIFIDRRQVLIQAEDAKTDADRFISIPDELLLEMAHLVNNYPPEYYVIGKAHRTKWVPGNQPAPTPFTTNFISKRFAKLRKPAGLTSDYTPYGFKHTRIIHLKQDGGQDADIMKLTGHTSYAAYADYLRDLGVDGNPDAINKISRKF